jgi:hypothetical protein
MQKRFLLVDFENLPKVDLATLPPDVTVPFFFGASQKSVSKDFLKSALRLGERFLPIDIEGQGKNALDFHIAYYLGETLAQHPSAECVILSRDKGFDPLVKHLVGRRFRVRRAAALAEAFPAAMPAIAPRGERAKPKAKSSRKSVAPAAPQGLTNEAMLQARNFVAGIPARNRPRKRKGLVQSLISGLGRRHDEAVVQAMVEQLIQDGVVQESGGHLSYRDTD